MSGKRFVALMSVVFCLCFAVGCSDDGDSGTTDTYAGTWTGRVCGRGLTAIVNQNGLSLNGSYALTDPDFSESFSGSVSSETPPASATLIGGGDRRIEITFTSYTSLSGGYFKGATKVCDISAAK